MALLTTESYWNIRCLIDMFANQRSTKILLQKVFIVVKSWAKAIYQSESLTKPAEIIAWSAENKGLSILSIQSRQVIVGSQSRVICHSHL